MAPLRNLLLFLFACSTLSAARQPAFAATLPTNNPEPKTLDTPRQFPQIDSRRDWLARAKEIRENVLVSCGLWPLPEKTPLHAHIFGKIDRDGYSIEKVYLETYPGFFLAGNLYRPLGRGNGPFPAILNPHGHWDEGRLADTPQGSIPARCISFARQGMIAFSYDMVGYNDTHFADALQGASNSARHHAFATNRTDLLWNISLMGLQTWNSIRALDFLESLPDADRHRLACTGESGGGTQTFMLGSVDSRLAAQAPVVMVSHIMQGGCLCENAPELRVDFSNMEIAAAPAPRPQMLVAASGDWTKDTLTVEGPAIAHVYSLLGAPEKFRYVRFNFGHNYNQTSREAVYAWFDQWLLHKPAADSVKEPPYKKEPDAALRVFPDDQLPAGALTQDQFIRSLRQLHQAQWQALLPRDKKSLRHFASIVKPAWQHTLQLTQPKTAPAWQVRQPLQAVANQPFKAARVSLDCTGDDAVLATYWSPPSITTEAAPKLVVLCQSQKGGKSSDAQERPTELALAFLQRGAAVLAIDHFSGTEPADQFAQFFSTYNRTIAQQRVRDLVNICAAAPSLEPRLRRPFRVVLTGNGPAAVWAMLAAPAADAVVADLSGLPLGQEEAWLAPELFCPGLLNFGGVTGPAMLAAPHPLCVVNPGAEFDAAALRVAYNVSGAQSALRIESGRLSSQDLANWTASLNLR